MKQTIYIDVLMAVNFFITYFLLLACAKFLALPIKRSRLAGASALGAVFALSVLLPEYPAVLSLLMKLLMSIAIVICAFGFGGIKRLIRNTLAFYVISFAFAGTMVAIWYFCAPQGLVIRNSVVYFNISPILLILLAATCYAVITLINRITGRQPPKDLFCRITVSHGGVSCGCSARVDTGNSLREPFSNYPVAVIERSVIRRLIPPNGNLNFRLIPYDAVSGSGVLKAFRPDRLTIDYRNKSIQVTEVYIAVSETKLGDSEALLNPDLLQTSG
ncbi:MAG TPA: sigma-E processing peptidase SpoIIGA [Caproicibacter sp.]|nr:sigma-E processing peptidase SpoIIGA [Caproicibacter sp.]